MQWEKVELAARMQNYIRDHCMDADFTMDALYEAAGYSRRHACRIFKELMDKTPEEYVWAVQMTASAESLIKTDSTILDIALDTNFESHEGYTRAFNKLFGTTPSRYRHGQVPIPLFVQYPIQHYYSYLKQKEIQEMENQSNTPQERESSQSICTVTVIHKPARKLLVMYAQKAHDYFSFCEEMSCEWEGLFNSIPNRLETAALMTLPPSLHPEGTTETAAGVELPEDIDITVPEGCTLLSLPPCDYLYFQSPPYEKEEDYCIAIESVFQASQTYRPERFGYAYAPELAPSVNFGADTLTGGCIALPVKKL